MTAARIDQARGPAVLASTVGILIGIAPPGSGSTRIARP